jgi:hypothetical protein
MAELWSRLNAFGRRRRGFRLSVADAAIIVVSAVATWRLLPVIGTYAWFVPIAVGHFFLFCNVFRIRRRYELIWAACFLGNVALWRFAGDEITPWGVLACQAPLTIGLIAMECLSPRYHGIFCRP